MSANQDSWDAAGKVEKAWKRLDPPKRDQLAKLLKVAPNNLSKLNKGNMLMSPAYAKRIVEVVPGLTVADLGAPEAVVVEQAPLVLDRLEELEAEVDLWKELLLEALALLGLQVNLEADQGSRVRRPSARQPRASDGTG